VRSEARRTWLYRIQPSANHPAFAKLERQLAGGPLGAVTPNRLRWNPLDIPAEPTDFIDGLVGMVANSGSEKPSGISIYNYRANRSMERVFFNADGELLIVPEQGR
ncbi:homogentisate 1,2-dioxygenase, partial [Klebsiella pneumoniae]